MRTEGEGELGEHYPPPGSQSTIGGLGSVVATLADKNENDVCAFCSR